MAVLTADTMVGGAPVENTCSLQDHYRMSSAPVSVDPASLRTSAVDNDECAASYDEYRRQVSAWIDGVEGEIIRCHGAIAAPVGASLREFFGRVSGYAEQTGARRAGMAQNLTAAAGRYEGGDADGAQAISAAGGGL